MSHDFLQVDDLLTDEDRAIRDTVRDFAQSELAPHIAEWYDEGTLPDDLGPRLGKLGLLGMHLEGYGCAGTSATAYGVACRELEAVDRVHERLAARIPEQGPATLVHGELRVSIPKIVERRARAIQITVNG